MRRCEDAMMLDEFGERWFETLETQSAQTCDCKLLLLLLQQLALSLDAPSISAEPAALVHDPVARDDEAHAIGRTGPGDGASRRRHAKIPGDLAVRARLAVRDRLQVTPDLPLERRRLHVHGQSEIRRPPVEVRDQGAHPFRERALLAANLADGYSPRRIALEQIVANRRASRSQSLSVPATSSASEEFDNREGNCRALRPPGIQPASSPALSVSARRRAARTVARFVDRVVTASLS